MADQDDEDLARLARHREPVRPPYDSAERLDRKRAGRRRPKPDPVPTVDGMQVELARAGHGSRPVGEVQVGGRL